MKKQAKYTERKSVRLSSRDAYILEQTGYTPREAIEFFNKIYCSTETKGLKLELMLLEEILKDQELEVFNTKEKIRIIKESIDNKEQTKFDNILKDNEPLSLNQCLAKIEWRFNQEKISKGIKSVEDFEDSYFIALAKQGNIEVEELKKQAIEQIK